MNLSNIQVPKIRLSVRVVAVLIGLIGLSFFFWATTQKIPEVEELTSALETENTSLKATEEQLRNLYNSMDFYLDETKRLHEETEIILEEFPTFMYLEDKILYAHNLVTTDLSGYNILAFTYGQSSYVTSTSYGSEGNPLELYSVVLNGKYYNLTYEQIKEILDYGLNSPQRFVMNQMTMNYTEKTGYISGEFSFTTYFIPGQTDPYVFPQDVIDGLGNSNRIDDLFGARLTPTQITTLE